MIALLDASKFTKVNSSKPTFSAPEASPMVLTVLTLWLLQLVTVKELEPLAAEMIKHGGHLIVDPPQELALRSMLTSPLLMSTKTHPAAFVREPLL